MKKKETLQKNEAHIEKAVKETLNTNKDLLEDFRGRLFRILMSRRRKKIQQVANVLGDE